jgi:hypothetical protein
MARDGKRIETLTHSEATRKNIPTAELQALVEADAAPSPPSSAEKPAKISLPIGTGS